MSKGNYFTRVEIEKKLSAIVDKTLGEVDVNHVFNRTKDNPKITGIAGDVIEQSVLGYSANPRQEADLVVDGIPVELKTTGIWKKKINRSLKFVAKEPASITAVSIDSIGSQTFENSSLWHKIEHLLFVFYHYLSKTTVTADKYAGFPIEGYAFYEFSDSDLAIIKNDWQLIHDFILQIQNQFSEDEAKKHYPNLSTLLNKKTVYLDTAPKYPNSPRFRLRKRVVDLIVDQTINKQKYESLPGNYSQLTDVEAKCASITRQYSGKTMSEILTGFGISHKDDEQVKQFAEQVVVRMFGGKSKKISKVDFFRKFGLIPKTVTLSSTDARTEDMKLLSVNFDELSNPELNFEESELYSYFHDHQMLCIIFKEQKKDSDNLGDNVFLGFKILSFEDKFLGRVKETWDDARRIIFNKELKFIYELDEKGNKKKNKSGSYKGAPNLPKSRDFDVFFRGTGNDGRDKVKILGVEMLRQNYWIKGTYVVNQLKSVPLIGSKDEANPLDLCLDQ